MFIIGVGVFTLGSLLSGFAPIVEMLNVARILQGIGSGLLNPQTVALIQQHFRGQDRARAFALLATTVAVATAVGPVMGGALIQVIGPESGLALDVPDERPDRGARDHRRLQVHPRRQGAGEDQAGPRSRSARSCCAWRSWGSCCPSSSAA